MKLSKKAISILVLAVLALFTTAAPEMSTNPDENVDNTALMGFKWSFYNVTALSTAVLVVSAGFAALVSLILPIFAYKICYVVGACPHLLEFYVDQLLTEDELPTMKRNPTKRSLEYVAPLLTSLAEAYDKYYVDDEKKKSNSPKS